MVMYDNEFETKDNEHFGVCLRVRTCEVLAEISWIYPLRFPKYYTITHLVIGDMGNFVLLNFGESWWVYP